MQFADNTDPDQPRYLHYPLTESMDTVEYVAEDKMLRSDCKDAQADLDLSCLQIA